MYGFFYDLHQSICLSQSLKYKFDTPKWLDLKKNPIMTRYEKYIKDDMYWKRLFALLRAICPVLKLLRISDSNKPGMDRIYHLSYKAHYAIEKSKEPLD